MAEFSDDDVEEHLGVGGVGFVAADTRGAQPEIVESVVWRQHVDPEPAHGQHEQALLGFRHHDKMSVDGNRRSINDGAESAIEPSMARHNDSHTLL